MPLTEHLDRPTRRGGTGRSFPLLAEQDPAYLVFQPVGFTEMPTSLPASVGFYLARRLHQREALWRARSRLCPPVKKDSTFSPVPQPCGQGSFPFCGTFRGKAVTSLTPSR
jgi:hypothetical protein